MAYKSQHSGPAIDKAVVDIQSVDLQKLNHYLGIFSDLGTRPVRGKQAGDYCYVGVSTDCDEHHWNGHAWTIAQTHLNLVGEVNNIVQELGDNPRVAISQMAISQIIHDILTVDDNQTSNIADNAKAIAALQKVAEALSKLTLEHSTSLTDHSNTLANHQTELNNHSQVLETHQTELANHAESISSLNDDIERIDNTDKEQQEQIGSNTTRITAVENRSSALEQQTTELNARTSELENKSLRYKGVFADASLLPTDAMAGDYAYVGTDTTALAVYTFGASWAATGEIVDLATVSNLDNIMPEDPSEHRAPTTALLASALATQKAEQDAKLTELEQEVKDLYGDYISNPEYIRAYTDSEGKFLWGIKTDGSIEFTKGIPTPIKNYIVELDKENDEEVERINQLVIGLLADVKGLTDTYHYISNPEWACAIVDSEERILMGIKSDGTYHIPNRDMYYIEDYPEYAEVVVDLEGRILRGTKKDGTVFFNKKENNELEVKVLEIENEVEELDKKTLGSYNPRTYFNTHRNFSPIVKDNGLKPLIRTIDTWCSNSVTYPDGTIFYADISGNSISMVSPDGVVSRILSLEGAYGGFSCLWFDSQYNLYVSPKIIDNTYASICGVYKLPYKGSTFTKVLSLYNPDSELESERTPANANVWTMTEDREGNLYAGGYGLPYFPNLYKSEDGGDTWVFLKDMAEYAPGGIHIHSIQYNKYDDCLYCIVGEVNKILKSSDKGLTWTDMGVTLERAKGACMHVVSDGIIVGSDDAYWGMIYKVYADGSYKTTAKWWANAVFSIRQSDLTGWLYAFSVIDSAVKQEYYYPPEEAVDDETALQAWIDSSPIYLSVWEEYYNSLKDIYPEDAIRPCHSAILCSKDNGESWEIIHRIDGNSTGMGGYFRNGECGVGIYGGQLRTVVISEGKHRYTSDGIDYTGDIWGKLQ